MDGLTKGYRGFDSVGSGIREGGGELDFAGVAKSELKFAQDPQDLHWEADNIVVADDRKHDFSWERCRASVVRGFASDSRLTLPSEWPGSLNVSVSLDKPLSWDAEKQEWRWHKTWRLPEVCVRVNDKEGRQNLEVRFSIVCVASNSNELEDVGLIVPERDQKYAVSHIVDSECRFSRLRLMGTSNTHGGKRFHFLVSIVERDSLGNQYVLASLISSAFSVYSRKDADKKRKKSESAGSASEVSIHSPFSPELFTRVFVKKISDHHGRTVEEPIDNSWAGLMRYFQAPNIRFKSRHPALLAVRFSNVVVILRDGEHYPESGEFTLRSFLCACGFPPQCRTPNCLSCYVRKNGPIGSYDGTFLAAWHISIRQDYTRPPEATRWISEHLSCVRSNTLGFIQDPSMLPPRFIPTDDIGDLQELYIKLYSLEFAAKAKPDRSTDRNDSLRMEDPRNGYGGMINDQNRGQGSDLVDNVLRAEKHELRPFVPGADIGTADSATKSQFAEFFVGLSSDIRQLRNDFSEASSVLVSECTEENIQVLEATYCNLAEALAMHCRIADTILFPELVKRKPGVAEAYSVDHYKQSGRLTQLHDLISTLDEAKATELFLQVYRFTALDTEHVEKEEEHLLPYFLVNFADHELIDLMKKVETAQANAKLIQ